jgi:internalin A
LTEFQYHYAVLPGSVISRFIVRMHAFSPKSTYWKNGILLEVEDAPALVKADVLPNTSAK